jgi:hypothetical protein
MRTVTAENLHDGVLISTPVNVNVDDMMTPREFRHVLPEMASFHRQALQSAQDVRHSAAVNAVGIDLAHAFLARERGKVPVSETGSLKRLDSGLLGLRVIDHCHHPVRQVSQRMSVVVRRHMASKDQPRMPV